MHSFSRAQAGLIVLVAALLAALQPTAGAAAPSFGPAEVADEFVAGGNW